MSGHSAPAPGSAEPLKGIACMVLGALLLTLSDATTKLLTEGYPTGQIIGVRAVFSLAPVFWVAWVQGQGRAVFQVNRPKVLALRVGAATVSAVLFVISLGLLPLADVIAIVFAGPLFVTAFAGPMLGEKVGWRRWLAVVIGFFGILAMVAPTGEAVRWEALVPITAALFGSQRDLLTRKLGNTESPAAILFYTMAVTGVLGLATLPFAWTPMPLDDFGMMILAGLFFGSAQFVIIHAFRYAEASLVIAFKYTTFVWGVLFGWLIWSHLPDQNVIAGSALIVGAGLYILHRERQQKGT